MDDSTVDHSPSSATTASSAQTTPILGFHALGDSTRYLNRELSWLQFNERVLTLAERPDLPLLERARFLAIFASNLDSFFQVRVAGIVEQSAAGVRGDNLDGIPPVEQLRAIRAITAELTVRQHQVFHDELVPELATAGIIFSTLDGLSAEHRKWLDDFFESQLFPVLTPLAVDPSHPFPYISSLSLNLAVLVGDPGGGPPRFARVKVPPVFPRFIVLPDRAHVIAIEDIVGDHLNRLFPGKEVVEQSAFRVTRNADFEIEEDADDLVEAIRSELTRRRFGRAIRLEITDAMSHRVQQLLVRELDLHDQSVVQLPSPLDLTGLHALETLERPDLRFPTFRPATPIALIGTTDNDDIFARVAAQDVLVHHPYESFTTSIEALIQQAAHDPQVLAIKQTLYRTSGLHSTVMRALMDAASTGKQVVALIEVKARFDEENNLAWAQRLEDAGVHVAYGVVGLKTHAKLALVVRREGRHIRRYVHVGTGNYNDATARVYEDLGLLTADPAIGADVSDLFNVLTGYAHQEQYHKLIVAPATFRNTIIDFITREREAPDGHIVCKVNSLVDPDIIEALYSAAATGTRIELLVRGICCLRPGVVGLSDTISVRSVVGKYLEHSRIYRFGSTKRGLNYFIGSGDLMPRNLSRRVEVLVPIEDAELRVRIDSILEHNLADHIRSWNLGSDAIWRESIPPDCGDLHTTFEHLAVDRHLG